MKAFFSLDVEDYYHLEYYPSTKGEKKYSMLDGLEFFLNACEKHSVPPNLFVLSDVVEDAKDQLQRAIKMGGKIGLHGLDHKRPLTLSVQDFKKDTLKSKKIIEDVLGINIEGYRAACFSLNRQYLDILISLGFSYDSSFIDFKNHPLYGHIDLKDFTDERNGIYKKNKFHEYEMTLAKIHNRNIPVTGGAYFRVFPYFLIENLTKTIIKERKIINFYTHTF